MASRWRRFAWRYCCIAGVAVAVVDIDALLCGTPFVRPEDGQSDTVRSRQSLAAIIAGIPMITLALDTSTRTGGCAVLRGDDVLADLPGDAARSHAERLPGDLMTVLARAQLTLRDVDIFAVATGPGSFTGLRV